MLRNPITHIVVLGILPRGYWQDPKEMFKLPSAFSRAIGAVNQELEHFAFGHQKMHYIDCTKAFVQTGNVSAMSSSAYSECMCPSPICVSDQNAAVKTPCIKCNCQCNIVVVADIVMTFTSLL